VITIFEPHKQGLIRLMLADSLILSLSQRLIPLKKGPGRILATEKLVNSHRIRNRIREQKTHHIRSQMQTGSEDFVSLDVALVNLYKKDLIKFEDGLRFAEDKQYYHEATSMRSD
jgi:twitching motility protein PilT